MFKYYLGLNSKFLFKHLFWQLVCFAFSFLVFINFVDQVWGQVVSSAFFIVYYIISAYCFSYKLGEKDSKSYSEHKPYALKGFTFVVLISAVNLVLLLLYFIFKAQAFNVIKLILEYFNFYLVFLLRADNAIKILSFVSVFLVPALSSFIGYLAGYHRYELGYKMFSKLVYKK